VTQPLFDDLQRTDSSSRHGETSFQFLNRSASSYFGSVRGLIEQWFGHFPEEHQASLRGQLRNDDAKFAAGFWELYLHEAYRRAGFEIEVHPSVPCASTRPDFLLTRGCDQFYLEATSISRPPREIAEEHRLDVVKDLLAQTHSPNFRLFLTVRSIGPSAPATKKLRRDLKYWVATLDPDAVAANAASNSTMPSFPWACDGWDLDFEAIPLRKSARHKDRSSALGGSSSGAVELVDNVHPLIKVLNKKRKHYGQLDHPLVVAVQLNTRFPTDTEDIVEALYGQAPVVGVDRADLVPERSKEGFWLGPDGWRNASVPQVVTISELLPWTATSSTPCCWTSIALNTDPPKQPDWLTQMTAGGDRRPPSPTLSMATHFGLAADWLGMGRPDFDRTRRAE